MKKICCLILSIFMIGAVFVGCSKESDETYYSDVYDIWLELSTNGEKVGEDKYEDHEFYSKDGIISFESTALTTLVNQSSLIYDFQLLRTQFLLTLNKINSNISELSSLFIHDPKLEGKGLRKAKDAVTTYKEAVASYKENVENFKNAKANFELLCQPSGMDETDPVPGEIETNALKNFEKEYTKLLRALNDIYSTMCDCANEMYLDTGASLSYENNDARINSIQSFYTNIKRQVQNDYIYWTFEKNCGLYDSSSLSLQTTMNKILALELNEQMLQKSIIPADIQTIDTSMKNIGTLKTFYDNEMGLIRKRINENLFKIDLTDVPEDTQDGQKIRQTKTIYDNFESSTLTKLEANLSTVVAFYLTNV